MTMKTSIVGGGNMARAIISGLLSQGCQAGDIMVIELDSERRTGLKKDFGVQVAGELTAVEMTHAIILAIKPQQLHDVAIALSSFLENQLIISIVAGVRCSDLAVWLGGYGALVRAMPNTPAQVQAGVTALYATSAVSQQQRQQAQNLLGAIGSCVWMSNEKDMDAVTAISGSGPAYVFYFLEAMQQAAVELGLESGQARLLAVQTILGTAKLALSSPHEFTELRAQVTSKGGTTEQALLSMESNEVKNAIVNAIHAAAARSEELGILLGKA